MFPDLFTVSLWDITLPVKTFGVCLVLAFGLFYWMLWRLGRKYQINTAFFSSNLLTFLLVTFFTSRIFHVLLFYGLPTKSAYVPEFWFSSFFLMSDFYFSVSGATIGFFGTFFFLFREREKIDREDALDIVVISWLFGAIVAYLGAFLGGQTYGIRNDSFFSVDYIDNPILAEFPRFPLALVYVFCIIFIFSLTYIIKKLRPERGLATGVGAFLWGLMWFIGEWWNDASSDNIAYIFGTITSWKIFNFNQLISLLLMAWGSWRIAHIIPSPLSDWIIGTGEKVITLSNTLGDALVEYSRKVRSWLQKK